MNEQRQQPNQQPAQQTAPATNSWQTLGRGIHNAVSNVIPFLADGATVQGPTMALLGEGGENEYVVPESKVAPWIQHTLATGNPPNPASLPRTDASRPPPPVIMGNTPQMCNGGKVVPAMADGGMVIPDGVRMTSRFPVPVPEDPFAPPDFTATDYSMPQAEPLPITTPPYPSPAAPPSVSRPSGPQASFEQRQRLQDMLKNRPMPKWYERPFEQSGGPSQLDMRAGVAPYSIAGRGANKLINAFLPINRKREKFANDYNAQQMAVENETAQNAAIVKQQELAQRGEVADSQIKANEARRLAEEARAKKLSAPAAAVDPYKDMVEIDADTAKRAGIVAGADGKFRVYKQNVRIPDANPKPTNETPAQGFERRNKEADDLIAKGMMKAGSPEHLNYVAGKNIARPPKQASGGAAKDKGEELLTPNEAMTLGVPYGTTRKGAAGIDPKKPLSDSAVKQIAEAKSAIQSVRDLRKILQDNEQYIGPMAGVQAYNPWSGARRAQADIDRVKQRVGKALEGGVLRKEDEEKYKKILATLTDDPKTAIYKTDQLIQNLESDISIFEEEQRRAGRRVGAATATAKTPSADGAKPGGEMIEVAWPSGKTSKVKPENLAAAEKAGAKRK